MPIPLLAALQFLTLIPPLVKRPFTEKELGQAVGFYSLVGLIIGAVLVGANMLLALVFPPFVRAALILALWVLMSGALHLDGFLDACDGIFGGFTPEKRLEIMHDERVGAFGLAGGVLLMMMKFTTLSALPNPNAALLLVPTLSRWGMSLALIAYPYARDQGLARAIKDNAGWKQLVLASVIAIITAWFTFQWIGLIALVMAGVIVWLAATFVLRRIPGLTGDIYGALNELVELVLIIIFVAWQFTT
ncbi:MAG: adenosylcobinamide-GDP ribazoletransferase [Anaerolineales bacterium]|nr:adenosylcobinamide-GDP ribazoletransferase [Chloroflexota bacterium]MBL7161624.1 adenosylcobinamide-GDP ribazoletransferase [Anaerolineales bacterium]